MCGICGIFHLVPSQRVEQNILEAMNARLVHRGPDDQGFFVDENIGLAVRRLSVIDVRGGHQPIANEDESLRIVCNGEIYNHQQLRAGLEARGHRYRTQNDTETVLHLYEEYGGACVEQLSGMFAFAIWDAGRKTLFIARDRVGIKPLYYLWDGKTLIFASEIKAILAHPRAKAELDRSTLAEYLAFGYLSGEQTMFVGIRKLLPGHTLEIAVRGHLEIRPYWDLSNAEDADERPRAHYVQTYKRLLEESVSSHLMSDVPLGVFLSGGLDSGAVAALMKIKRREPIQTFSVGYGEEAYSELPHARELATYLGAEHHEVQLSCREFFDLLPRLIWHEDEPITWPSSIALYVVARLARQHVTVVLTGEGSDETLAGYSRYAFTLRNLRLGGAYRTLTPAPVRRWISSVLGAGSLPAAWHRRLGHTFLTRDGEPWASYYFDNFYSAFSSAGQDGLLSSRLKAEISDAYRNTLSYWDRSSGGLLHRMLYTDIKTYLVELLMKQDQMSMAASVESRVPFLDHKLVEFAASIPARYMTDGLSGKSILKEAAADLLPNRVVHRRKLGFPTPWDAWLAGAQFNVVQEMLLEPRTMARGLFNEVAVRQLMAEHRTGRRDHGSRFWRLLTLETWQRIFLDGELPSTAAVLSDASVAD